MHRIQYHRYGGPETMLEEFELAPPRAAQVAVTVKAAAVNPIEWKVRQGQLKMMTGRSFPRAMGSDFAGVVRAAGPGVTRFVPGDQVYGITALKPSGAFAEAVITTESNLAVKPAGLSFEQAACLATPAVMAWSGLIDRVRLQDGQRVFVNGCTGGVCEAVVQVARTRCATITGTCNRASLPRARQLGMDPGLHGGRATVDEQAWPLHSHLELAARPGAVPRARHHARRVLADWDLGALGETAELVVSELVTNAIQACPAAGARRQVRLRLASDRARVLIKIQDGSPQPPVPADAAADDESGRGLCLVEAMSAAWDWYPHRPSGGKVVWALLPAAC